MRKLVFVKGGSWRKHFVTITAREVQLSLVPLHVCGKFIGAGELFVAHLAQGLPHHHLFLLLVLATCLAVPACDLLTRKLFATHHTGVDQPALDTRVSLFVKSEAVSPVGGEAAVGETALKLLHFSMTPLVSPQITWVSKSALAQRTNVWFSGTRSIMVSIHIHLSFSRDKIGYQFVQDREILFERLLNVCPVFNSLSVSWRPIMQKYC